MPTAYETLASFLRDMGLGALTGVTAQGTPTGWLWSQFQQGVDTPDELAVAVEQTDIWRDRFGVIVEQRARAGRGEPVQVMTPEEVVAYEKQVGAMFRNAGLPAWFYDSYKDFQKPILAGQSPAEINDRLGAAFDRARNEAPEVRAAFEHFYGVGAGDASLAAFFLDADRTVDSLERASRAALAAGMGKKYGIGDIDRATAERITTFATSDAAVREGLSTAASLTGLTNETIGEATDITTGDVLESVFARNARETTMLNRRLAQRRSANTAGIGGAALTQRGLVGAGTA